jgi:hypothetical protein
MNDDEAGYPQPPDLQEWIARYGSYSAIDWAAWDRAMAAWHIARRIHTAGHINEPTNRDTGPARRRAR